jgi:hypothetical protein
MQPQVPEELVGIEAHPKILDTQRARLIDDSA